MADIDPDELAGSMAPPDDSDGAGGGDDDLKSAMADLGEALAKKDYSAAATAFKAAIALVDSKG